MSIRIFKALNTMTTYQLVGSTSNTLLSGSIIVHLRLFRKDNEVAPIIQKRRNSEQFFDTCIKMNHSKIHCSIYTPYSSSYACTYMLQTVKNRKADEIACFCFPNKNHSYLKAHYRSSIICQFCSSFFIYHLI